MKATNEKTAVPQPVPFLPSCGINMVAGVIAWQLGPHTADLVKNSIVNGYRVPEHLAHRIPPKEKMWFSWSRTAVMTQTLYHEGGIARLHRGIGTGQIRQCIYTPARLTLYDPVIAVFTQGGKREATVVDRMLAGGTAGALAGFVTSPVEVPLVRLTKSGAQNLSFIGSMKQVYADSGFFGFYRGVGPLMQRTFVVGVCQVGFFKQTHAVLTHLNDTKKLPTGVLTPQQLVMATSIITGIFYALITLPLEQARVRMAAQAGKVAAGGAPLKYRNSVQTITTILKEEGVRSMFSFFTPYATRCILHTITSFNVIHVLQGQYRKKFLTPPPSSSTSSSS